MKRVLGLLAALLVWSSAAFAQAPMPNNVNNLIFFVSGCATYVPMTPPPGIGAQCVDTTTGGIYLWNGSAFVIGGSEIWSSNGGAGATTATTLFFSAGGNSSANASEAVTMELPIGPNPVYVRSLSCQDSTAPGGATSDAFTIRTATSLGGTMGTTTVTCTITGSAKTCTSAAGLQAALPAGSVIDLQDVTSGVQAARTIACALQVDEL